MAIVVSAVAPGLTSGMYDAVSGRAMPGDQLPGGMPASHRRARRAGMARHNGVGVA